MAGKIFEIESSENYLGSDKFFCFFIFSNQYRGNLAGFMLSSLLSLIPLGVLKKPSHDFLSCGFVSDKSIFIFCSPLKGLNIIDSSTSIITPFFS